MRVGSRGGVRGERLYSAHPLLDCNTQGEEEKKSLLAQTGRQAGTINTKDGYYVEENHSGRIRTKSQ